MPIIFQIITVSIYFYASRNILLRNIESIYIYIYIAENLMGGDKKVINK